MFGSLVIVFPTPHEGGSLLLRHHGQEWNFDSGQVLESKSQPSIGYVAFFSDIEHEVVPVTSGHRITLTYNLYFDDDGTVSANDTVPKHLNAPQPANESAFRETFKALLENPEFLADGGALAFGLRHVYPINGKIKHVYNILKGSDAAVYQTVRALGYEPVLYLYYDYSENEGMIIDKVVSFDEGGLVDQEILDIINEKGGTFVARGGKETYLAREYGMPEQMEWVTPVTEFNRQNKAYAGYLGNEHGLGWTYSDVCLVVRIGEAGDRLAYETVGKVHEETTDEETDEEMEDEEKEDEEKEDEEMTDEDE